MRIQEYFHPIDIIADLSSVTKDGVLRELTGKFLERRPDIEQDEIIRSLMERERLGSTGIGGGIAIPHAKAPRIGEPAIVLGRSTTGIAYDALDGRPVYLFFLLISDTSSIDVHLNLLARISRLMKDRALRIDLLNAADSDAMYACIGEQDSRL